MLKLVSAAKPAIILAALLGCSTGARVFGLSLDQLLPGLSEAQKKELLDKKELVVFSGSAPDFKLLPRHALASKVREQFSGYSPNVTDEALFLLPLPETGQDPSSFLYARLRAISSLSGIEYFSNHYKQKRVLFSDVYEVDSLSSRAKVADRTGGPIPAGGERFPFHINDVNFGGGYYEADYSSAGGGLAFGFRNKTSLSFFFIPVIGEERVRFHLAAIPLREDGQLLVYGVCSVEAGDFIKSMIDLPSSFYTRIKALRDWFKARLQ